MSKEGNDDQSYQRAENLGYRNKELLVSVRQWCKHIKVEGQTGSMLGQMLNIPMSTTIGCPHAPDSGFTGPNLEWNARDFVIQNCLNCKKHEPLTADNYGVQVAAGYFRYQEKKHAEEKAEQERLKTLLSEAERLINKEKSKAEIKILSVLKLVENLQDADGRSEQAAKILESAKLSPEFFSEAAIDYIAMFADDESHGPLLLEAISILQTADHVLSSFSRDRIMALIEQGVASDLAAGIWTAGLRDEALVSEEAVLKMILTNCRYENFYGMRPDASGSYPRSVALFHRLHIASPDVFNALFSNQLKIEDKITRVNVNGLLQDIAITAAEKLLNFLPLLVQSFDFKDDTNGGQSGDHQTIVTIEKLYAFAPDRVIAIVESEGGRLTEWGQAELIKFYGDLLNEDELFEVSEVCSAQAMNKLLDYLMGDFKRMHLIKSTMDQCEQIVRQRAQVLLPHFDALLGFLIRVNEEQKKFEWYREDAENSERPTATFNPLVGKSILDLESQAQEIRVLLHDTARLVSAMIEMEPDRYFSSTLKVIEELDSKTSGLLKAQLIGVLQAALKDVITLSEMLPHIYRYIQDMEAEEVRVAGMNYIMHLTTSCPQLITQTMIEMVKVFLKDPLPMIRALAIEAYGNIIGGFPAHADKLLFGQIRELVVDKYVIVHKAAADFAYRAYHFLTLSERRIWVLDIYRVADYYLKMKDFDYLLKLINILLYLTADELETHRRMVEQLLIPCCNCKSYYEEKEALTRLTSLTSKFPHYASVWITEAIGFLSRTIPEGRFLGGEDRVPFFDFFYHLSEADLSRDVEHIVEHVKITIAKITVPIMPDVIHFYGILAYFNLWAPLKELADYFEQTVPRTPLLANVHRFNDQSIRLARTELRVAEGSLDHHYIQSLNHGNS